MLSIGEYSIREVPLLLERDRVTVNDRYGQGILIRELTPSLLHFLALVTIGLETRRLQPFRKVFTAAVPITLSMCSATAIEPSATAFAAYAYSKLPSTVL